MNKKGLIIAILLLVILFSISVSAAGETHWFLTTNSPSSGSSDIGRSVGNILTAVVNGLVGIADATINLPMNMGQTSSLAMILTFIVMFALIYPATGLLSLFKPRENRGARKAFAVAFAILVVFFSPASRYVQEFILVYFSTLVSLGLFALFIVAIWWIWVHSRKGIASANKVGAEATKISSANKKMNAESHKIMQNAKNEEKMLRRERDAIDDLQHLTHQERSSVHDQEKRWHNIRDQIRKLESMTTDAGTRLSGQIINELSAVMRSEHHQDEVNDLLYRLSMKNKNVGKKLTHLVNISDIKYSELLDHLKDKHGVDERHAKRMIDDARHNAVLLYNLSKRLDNFAWQEEKYNSKVNDQTIAVISALIRGNATTAGHHCEEVIKELKKEEKLLNELKYTEGRMRKIEKHVFDDIINFFHDESNLESTMFGA